jgi:hypothetical protein
MLKSIQLVIGMYAVGIATGIYASSLDAHVHHDADGRAVTWYPSDCCGQGDCKPVTEVQRVGAGFWLKTADGIEMFIASAEPRKQSHDLRWHICVRFDHDAQSMVVDCVFEPDGTADNGRPATL